MLKKFAAIMVLLSFNFYLNSMNIRSSKPAVFIHQPMTLKLQAALNIYSDIKDKKIDIESLEMLPEDLKLYVKKLEIFDTELIKIIQASHTIIIAANAQMLSTYYPKIVFTGNMQEYLYKLLKKAYFVMFDDSEATLDDMLKKMKMLLPSRK